MAIKRVGVTWKNICFNRVAQYANSADFWDKISTETATALEILFTRYCPLNCLHCAFSGTKDTAPSENENDRIVRTIVKIASQLPKNGRIISAGRILTARSLETFRHIHSLRPDIRLNLIDSGYYTVDLAGKTCVNRNEPLFDRLDISLDGLEAVHNRQRNQKKYEQYGTPWSIANQGIEQAPRLLKPNGTLSALMTISRLNFDQIEPLSDYVFSNTPVDELHISFMMPIRRQLQKLMVMGDIVSKIWRQLKKAFRKYNNRSPRIFFRLFALNEFELICQVLGEKVIKKALRQSIMIGDHLVFTIDGVTLSFLPGSLFAHDGIVIDADATCRFAYMQRYSLGQYANNRPGTERYTAMPLTEESKLSDVYPRHTELWRKRFGERHLAKEINFFCSLIG